MRKLTILALALFLAIAASACKKGEQKTNGTGEANTPAAATNEASAATQPEAPAATNESTEAAGDADMNGFGSKLCEIRKNGDVEGLFAAMPPSMSKFMPSGADLDKMKADAKASGEALESCEVASAEEVDCSAEESSEYEKMGFKAEKCGVITFNIQVKGQEPNVDEKGKPEKPVRTALVDGNWYFTGEKSE